MDRKETSFKAEFPDGSSLLINAAGASGRKTLKVTINLASCVKKTSGICGPLRGADVKTPDQYKLADKENMFKKGAYAVIKTEIDNFSPPKGFEVCKAATVKCPSTATPKPQPTKDQKALTATTATTVTTPTAQVTTQVYEDLVSTYDPKANNDTDVYVLDTSEELSEEFCRNECKKVIEGTSCEAIVSSSFYVDACITDLRATGDKTLIESNRLAYARTCATLSKTSGNSTLELKQKIGFDNNTCPNNCTSVNHGICGEDGCECLPDYSGFDCSTLVVVPIQSIASALTSILPPAA